MFHAVECYRVGLRQYCDHKVPYLRTVQGWYELKQGNEIGPTGSSGKRLIMLRLLAGSSVDESPDLEVSIITEKESNTTNFDGKNIPRQSKVLQKAKLPQTVANRLEICAELT